MAKLTDKELEEYPPGTSWHNLETGFTWVVSSSGDLLEVYKTGGRWAAMSSNYTVSNVLKKGRIKLYCAQEDRESQEPLTVED